MSLTTHSDTDSDQIYLADLEHRIALVEAQAEYTIDHAEGQDDEPARRYLTSEAIACGYLLADLTAEKIRLEFRMGLWQRSV